MNHHLPSVVVKILLLCSLLARLHHFRVLFLLPRRWLNVFQLETTYGFISCTLQLLQLQEGLLKCLKYTWKIAGSGVFHECIELTLLVEIIYVMIRGRGGEKKVNTLAGFTGHILGAASPPPPPPPFHRSKSCEIVNPPSPPICRCRSKAKWKHWIYLVC